METTINLRSYWENTQKPWGKLFYLLAWRNLEFSGKKVLDFGSGFGATADHLAARNSVTAVELDARMAGFAPGKNSYELVTGGLEKLDGIPGGTYDVIVCHNVLEYIGDRPAVFAGFDRLLKPDGVISLIKHNTAGKIMQKAVFENNIAGAMQLIEGGKPVSKDFGVIDEYTTANLEEYMGGRFEIRRSFGIRTFFGLQRNEFKMEEAWLSSMYKLESLVEEIPEFRDIAFYHHHIIGRPGR